jgi:hypothetical protein
VTYSTRWQDTLAVAHHVRGLTHALVAHLCVRGVTGETTRILPAARARGELGLAAVFLVGRRIDLLHSQHTRTMISKETAYQDLNDSVDERATILVDERIQLRTKAKLEWKGR